MKYEGTSTDGDKGSVWVDARLHFLVKMSESNGDVTEFRNIHEGSQPGSLFEVPAGYQKMDVGSMMNRPPSKH